MKVKQKVTIDGQEREIEIELDANQFLTIDQHKLRLNDAIKKRLARHSAELMQDEEFVAKVLKAKGIDPANPGGGRGNRDGEAEVIARVQGEIRKNEVEPLKKQLTELTETLGKTRSDQLVSELEAAFLEGDGNTRVKKGVARRLAELEVQRGAFAFVDDHRYWAVKDGDGFAYAPSATQQRPYKGTKEFAVDFVKDKNNADFIERTSQQGPGLNNTGTGNPGGIKSRADFASEAAKVKWISENGYEAFTKLPEK
jgi:hypothetical protein